MQKIRLAILLSAIGLAPIPRVHAELVPLFGHNLTPTTYGLKSGEITAGTYALAYGLSDWLTVGTSPWLDISYNMPNVDVRTSFALNSIVQRIAFEGLYFKTLPYLDNWFVQESLFFRSTAEHRFGSRYVLNASVGYQYFFNDLTPFSLRLNPGNVHTAYNLSASTLHEIDLGESFGIFLEIGLIGLNYQSPYLHTGASMFARWGWGMAQLGLSRSASISPVDYSYSTGSSRVSIDYPVSPVLYHPEVQLQAYF